MRKKVYAAIICIFAAMLFCGAVYAQAEGTLSIEYECDGIFIPDAAVKLYQVAYMTGDGAYVLTNNFDDYSVAIANDGDSAQERSLAITLSAYVNRDKIVPDNEGSTDSEGKIVFVGLTDGLYLVISEERAYNNRMYVSEPFLVYVPDNTEGYYIAAKPKLTSSSGETPPPHSGGGFSSYMSISVAKVWKDSDNSATRPDMLTVQLLHNGSVYDEVKLDRTNGWKYTWASLSRSGTWEVAEKDVPDGYTVAVEKKNNNTYIVTNTYSEKDKPSPSSGTPRPDGASTPRPGENVTPAPGETATSNPEGSSTPQPGDSGPIIPKDPMPTFASGGSTLVGGGSPGGGSNVGSGGGSGGGKLPQTGQLWWPVPCAAILGIILLIYARSRLRSGKDEQNE